MVRPSSAPQLAILLAGLGLGLGACTDAGQITGDPFADDLGGGDDGGDPLDPAPDAAAILEPDADTRPAWDPTTPAIQVYPVRAAHNNGYESPWHDAPHWSCANSYSNSDFIQANNRHLGNDIWAARGAPVAAPVTARSCASASPTAPATPSPCRPTAAGTTTWATSTRSPPASPTASG